MKPIHEKIRDIEFVKIASKSRETLQIAPCQNLLAHAKMTSIFLPSIDFFLVYIIKPFENKTMYLHELNLKHFFVKLSEEHIFRVIAI